MSRKTILITGATSGIGQAASALLLQHGYHVIIAGRDATKTVHVTESLRQQTNCDAIDYVIADLSSQADIRALVTNVKAHFDRLDVLINNAGLQFLAQRKESTDGIEMHFAVNYLGTFLLTLELLDLLAATGRSSGQNARVVNTASAAHRVGHFGLFSDLQSERFYHPVFAYGKSKLGNIMFSYALARRVKGKPITVNVLNPGTVNTNPGVSDTPFVKFVQCFVSDFLVEPEVGAATTVYLATADEIANVSGGYWMNKKQVPSSGFSQIVDYQEHLWEISQELL
ncbi:MAG: hypothetical protein GFH27_549283n75 [Chloroflexi bacterium AL-W]|nr:hypothetical protein [Chloroflexi bacterium AL-N1]NOK64804.1 hypothetical protein [Chloroflexi bacterium AL-N10]NOK76574.1 hypothetical protein [Chloroflexi bacterium AL-N5]NOK80196.1 hypothetical protein [Chloroflexi bacterium AL-W]NOK86709.1 hypothetical protein [Chloroflexi bacterium AL-N15]